MEAQHSAPNPWASAPKQRQRRKCNFQSEATPCGAFQQCRRKSEEPEPKISGPRQRVREYAFQSAAIAPRRTRHFHSAAIRVANSHDYPSDQVNGRRHPPISVRFSPNASRERAERRFRQKGMRKQQPSDIRKRRIRDKRIAAQETRAKVPKQSRSSPIPESDREKEGKAGRPDQERLNKKRRIPNREDVWKEMSQRTQ